MSRSYNLYVEITEFDKNKKDNIIKTLNNIWPADYGYYGGDLFEVLISGGGDNHLCGGQTEDDSFEEIYTAIWETNGNYCKIIINYTYLEDLPYEKFETSRDIYDTIKKGTI